MDFSGLFSLSFIHNVLLVRHPEKSGQEEDSVNGDWMELSTVVIDGKTKKSRRLNNRCRSASEVLKECQAQK